MAAGFLFLNFSLWILSWCFVLQGKYVRSFSWICVSTIDIKFDRNSVNSGHMSLNHPRKDNQGHGNLCFEP